EIAPFRGDFFLFAALTGLVPALHALSLWRQPADARHGAARDGPKAGSSPMDSDGQYLPLTPGLFSVLVLLFGVLVILIQLGILRYAYMKLGIGPGMAMLLLLGSLIGSFYNIPVAFLPGSIIPGKIVDYYGMYYVVP